jgi:glutamate N-acetyltransferase/amino-acid N-acetyltransferase
VSITGPAGFRAAAVAAGLKSGGGLDLAVVVNDGPARDAAAVFTRNRIQAAPVLWSRQVVGDGRVDVVVLNSGGANACTGPEGFADTHRTAERAAQALGCSAGDVAVCSTGLIGELLPMDRLLPAVDQAVQALRADGGPAAARAIMTTDTVPKEALAVRAGWSVGGMAKGAGMLAPALATMLVVLTTDAVTDQGALEVALRQACAATFERVDSDGCLSTNDTVLALASGASGVAVEPAALADAVLEVCGRLAAALVADAEGASHEVAITVRGAADEADALEVARAVARNNLVKCAIFGRDPNWGRILAAVGTTAAAFDPARVDVALNGVAVCRASGVGADRALVDLTPRRVDIDINLHAGASHATVWTNDLTHDYVHENSAYST